MPTLVVTTQGAVLRCAGGQVLVECEGKVVSRLPQMQVERALLLGGVGMTTGFVNFALEQRVPVTFLSQEGGYKGRLDTGGRRDIAARVAQYQALTDIPFRLSVSRQIVRAKLLAQRGLLMRCHRNGAHPGLQEAATEIKELSGGLDRIATLPALMGREGIAARVYFAALPRVLRRPLPFRGRSRRPPKDPVNALLSLGYGLLTAEIIGALAGAGLEPQVGLFHSPRGRMPALAEDVLELFRAPVADALAVALVNLGVLQAEDFEAKDNGAVLLTKAALEVYFKYYRRRMQATFKGRDGQPTSFRREVQAQAAHLRRVLLREEEYQPFIAPAGGPAGVGSR